MPTPLEEKRARHLRDVVFGKPITDEGWAKCGQYWLEKDDLHWLEDKAGAEHQPLSAEKSPGRYRSFPESPPVTVAPLLIR